MFGITALQKALTISRDFLILVWYTWRPHTGSNDFDFPLLPKGWKIRQFTVISEKEHLLELPEIDAFYE